MFRKNSAFAGLASTFGPPDILVPPETGGHSTKTRQDDTGNICPRKGTVSMANTIEAIPENARWEIATKALTGAYIAISNALKQPVGQKGIEECNGPRWYQAGKGGKGFAGSVGLAGETAREV